MIDNLNLETPLDKHPKYGKLLNDDLTIQRHYFEEMCEMVGVNVVIYTPRKDKNYTTRGGMTSNYNPPKLIGCIFNEYPDQKTLKKLGWVSELQEASSIIHLPYDLDNLQQGTLVVIPSGIDGADGRVFRVVKMSNIMVYPASITCEIIPEWADTVQKAEIEDFHQTDFNLLYENEEEGV